MCNGICGKEYSKHVYELNRLCRTEDLDLQLSEFVGACLRKLKVENWIVVSYSDTGMHHNGYIYQACNFLYTGRTKQRTDPYSKDVQHHRHLECGTEEFRQVRTAKNRYVYFCTSNKKLKKKWMENLKYPILSYPKEKNEHYILGEYMRPIIIKVR